VHRWALRRSFGHGGFCHVRLGHGRFWCGRFGEGRLFPRFLRYLSRFLRDGLRRLLQVLLVAGVRRFRKNEIPLRVLR
jgi:hypothetical protein